ncbi:hypothetical protein [Streptomyces sp. Ag109_O5-1]|uniref:hypothetical protein n=1 Tax=Streptomyces sp. Ag109_O5-1 TaxID=1938851 RepID=UPI000F4D5A5E|nr:hypothetical protein [Streptomyces sp. Ag109_O5-1]
MKSLHTAGAAMERIQRANVDQFVFGERPLIVGPDGYGHVFYEHSSYTPPAVSAAIHARHFALGRKEMPRGAVMPVAEGTPEEISARNPFDAFNQQHLVVPGGPQWREAASTAVCEPFWTTGMDGTRTIDEQFVALMRAEVRMIHRQLVPVWRHKINGLRVLQLEAPLWAGGLTLLDVVAGELRMEGLVFETAFDDPRVDAVLRGLTEDERRVAMAWAHPYADTWTEAARLAGAADPEAFGERVRRKLKRLGSEYTRRRTSALQKTVA